jgi:hypothetical protein
VFGLHLLLLLRDPDGLAVLGSFKPLRDRWELGARLVAPESTTRAGVSAARGLT